LAHRQHIEEDLDAEIRAHFDILIERNIAKGMSHQTARREATLEFGGREQVKQAVREARLGAAIGARLRDVRYALRGLRNHPGFAAIVLLTLALGIGANTAIFTVDYATLLAPLPYPDPDRLVMVWARFQEQRNRVSAGDFTDWKRQSKTFEDLNASGSDDFNIATRDRPEFVEGMDATPGYYGMLGKPLFLGRNFLFAEGEPGNQHVVILTHRLWQHLGANLKIIGTPMQINGESYTVVGVLAPGTADRWDEELIVPLVFKPEDLNDHASRDWLVTGRLKPGLTIGQAQAELSAISAKEAKDYPGSNRGWGALVQPFRNNFLSGERQLTLWLLLGAVGFLLVIACLNVANLLLARGITRQREVAIRNSLGATEAAIFAQFLTESLALAIMGGLLGIAAGYAMVRGLIAVMPPNALPAEADLRLNVSILIVMSAVATLTGVCFGCAPAWYASRRNAAGLLKEGERSGTGVSGHRLRRALVIAEFALALPLLAAAGLAVHSLWKLTHVDLGVRTDHILGFYLNSVPLEKNPGQTNVSTYYRRMFASIEALPGVSRVCAMTYLPVEGLHWEMPFSIAGQPAYANPSLRPHADLQTATPGYFDTFGIRILKGRAFNDDDIASGMKVAMVNEAFAKRFLHGVNPIQQRVVMENAYDAGHSLAVEWQIVGVFHNVKSRGSREDSPEIDISFWQAGSSEAGIGVRTVKDPAAMIRSISTAVAAVDPQAAIYKPRTMEQVHDEVLANDRFTVILFAGFAVVALSLATVGIYGVMAFSVNQRSHEFALRMALGAARNRVVALIVKEGFVLACTGLGLGLIGAVLVGHAMQSILFGVVAVDFSTLAAVGLLLLLAALLACYLPARRVTRHDPMIALRHE
jgi:putative ABC transport system permease protein